MSNQNARTGLPPPGDYLGEIEVDGETYSPEQQAWYPFRWRPPVTMPAKLARHHPFCDP
jgi:hypothetical protein